MEERVIRSDYAVTLGAGRIKQTIYKGVMSMGRYFTIQGTGYRFDMSGGPADIVRIFKYVDGCGYQFAHEALDLESAINYCETNGGNNYYDRNEI